MQVKEEAGEASKHSHKLTPANLHACSTCGRFIATSYRETKTGEIVIEEVELDVKIVSSRISRLLTLTPRKYARPEPPPDTVMTVEDTCW